MGLGPPVLALYRQLKGLGFFDGITDVMELGAQNVWCPKPSLVNNLFQAFGKPAPAPDMLDRFTNWKGSGLELYTALGFTYRCIDLDPQFNSIPLDLNFDECPAEHVGKYGFVTNHGTSEHVLNQYNVFKIMHDLTKVGGFMLHAVPFTVHLDHGFFNYQPNFFEALARYNSYETGGIWVGPGWQVASFIPWEVDLLDYLVLNSKTTHLLVVLLQKKYDQPFCVPFQGVYEAMTSEKDMARYSMVVDGQLYDGKRVRYISKEGAVEQRVAQETVSIRQQLVDLGRENRILRQQVSAAGGDLQALAVLGPASLPSAVNIPGIELLKELGRRVRRRAFVWR
jgi:hypothetical protein